MHLKKELEIVVNVPNSMFICILKFKSFTVSELACQMCFGCITGNNICKN